MSGFWSAWVIVIFVVTVAGVCWVLFANRKIIVRHKPEDGEAPKTGHVYDGIEEYDNPLPAWWFNMFVATVVFSGIYVLLYPGLGNFPGLLGWTSSGQWQAQQERKRKRQEKRKEKKTQIFVSVGGCTTTLDIASVHDSVENVMREVFRCTIHTI